MVELSRRFFLGGAIALIAAQTFKPSLNAMSNMPTIHGDGITDDSYGLGCLFRNEPVIFKKDQLGIDEHKGVIFYSGRFAVERTINLPKDAKIEMYKAHFYGTKLDPVMPFFLAEYGFDARQFDSGQAIFELKTGAPNRLIQYSNQSNPIINPKMEGVTVGPTFDYGKWESYLETYHKS